MHKINIHTKILLESSNKVIGSLDKKKIRPILGYSLLELTAEGLILRSTDMEVAAQCLIPESDYTTNQMASPFRICLDLKKVTDILKDFPDEACEIAFNLDQNKMILNLLGKNYSFTLVEAKDYPWIDHEEDTYSGKISSDTFRKALKKLSHSISHDETRPYLNGVFFEWNAENPEYLNGVSTDGHRLSLVTSNDVTISPERNSFGIVIPSRAVNEFKRVLDLCEDEEIKIKGSESFFKISFSENFFMKTQLLEKNFPQYKNIIPQSYQHEVQVKKTDLLATIKRSQVFLEPQNPVVQMMIVENEICISAAHQSTGEAKEIINTSYEGEPLHIKVNSRYFIDSLSSFEEEVVSLKVSPETAALFISGNAQQICVIMTISH